MIMTISIENVNANKNRLREEKRKKMPAKTQKKSYKVGKTTLDIRRIRGYSYTIRTP